MNATLKLGEHFIFDLSDCNHEILMDSERAYSLFAQAVHESGLTVVDEGFYKFSPHGFTCFLLLAESHASLHAWPEHNYCDRSVYLRHWQGHDAFVDVHQAGFWC